MLRLAVHQLTHRTVLFLFVCLIPATTRLDAQTAVRVGSEFLVNQNTPGSQGYSEVGVAPNGSFIVLWSDYNGQDGSDRGAFARRFNASGVALATEFQINSYTAGAQAQPAVDFDASGAFVVAWTSYGGQDGNLNGIFAQRFSSTGARVGAEFQVNTYTTGYQLFASVSRDLSGDFVVVWTSFNTGQDGSASGVFGRRFDATGTPQAAEFQINEYTSGQQQQAAVSLDDDGDFVVAWTSIGQDGSGRGVFARRFDSAGAPKDSEFQANSSTAGDQMGGAVSLDPEGDFVVVWNAPGEVRAQRFDAFGAFLSTEFVVNPEVAGGYASGKSIEHDASGDFVIAWQSGEPDVRVRHFNSHGVPLASEFVANNSYTTGNQLAGAASINPSGSFVVSWHGTGEGDDVGIFAQRFRIPALVDVDGDGEVDPLTDGVLLLREMFLFTGATLVSGAVDLTNCTRCTAPEIEAYIDTLK